MVNSDVAPFKPIENPAEMLLFCAFNVLPLILSVPDKLRLLFNVNVLFVWRVTLAVIFPCVAVVPVELVSVNEPTVPLVANAVAPFVKRYCPNASEAFTLNV